MAVDRSVAEVLAERVASLDVRGLPHEVNDTCDRLLIDIIGLCVAARATDYVQAARRAWPDAGAATIIGFPETRSAAAVAFINGTAAHGEDFDDTFEGGPVHAGTVMVPALLAAAEQENLPGSAARLGIAVGAEVICRLSRVVPKAVHRAGFHPTAVFGALGAAVGIGTAIELNARQLAHAMGIAGSMASGIIEYLADGSWTKRMHPGWAAQSGLRAALLARAGFTGPRTVFEGAHGLFQGFAHRRDGDYGVLLDRFGERWLMQTLAFKSYPCGTMIHPYIDCARRLRDRGIDPSDVTHLVCEVAEGAVHRLWEPLAEKQRPPNGYAAKFSTPYGIAVGLAKGDVRLDAFTGEAVSDPVVRRLAAKVRYEIDPGNPYPNEYTGHIRAHLRDGRVVEERQLHLRGGARQPMSRAELEAKAAANLRAGGWPDARIERTLALARSLWDGPIDLAFLRI